MMKKISNYLWLLVGFGSMIYVIYKISRNIYTDHLLKSESSYTKAIVINQKNFPGDRSSDFSYSYRFTINGKSFTGNSHDPTKRLGDTVDVKYYAPNPAFNKPVNPKE